MCTAMIFADLRTPARFALRARLETPRCLDSLVQDLSPQEDSMFIGSVSISDSLQRGLDQLVGFLPRLIGFLIIVLIGWLIARAVKALLIKALEGVGIDRALSSGSAGPYVARVI